MPNAFRVAGWGTLGFSIAFFVTFVVNALMNMGSSGPDYPTASEMAADFGGGALFMLTVGHRGSGARHLGGRPVRGRLAD